MKTILSYLIKFKVLLLAFAVFCLSPGEPVQAQTIDIGPNEYAFQLSINPNYGLFFNANAQRFEFLNGDAQPVFGFDADNGNLTTNLELNNNSDYLVPNNRYAFRAKSYPDYGLFFNASQLQYEFRNHTAAPAFALSATSGELVLNGGVNISNSTSSNAGTIRWNGDLEIFDGSDWTSLTAGGASGKPSLQAAYDEGKTINATEGAVKIAGEDGFVVSGTLLSGFVANYGPGTHMFFNPRKAAFRAGTVSENIWDDAALGFNSVGMGEDAAASGSNAVAIGQGVTAPSAYEVVLGSNNTLYTPASTTSWDDSDRIFTVGNGTSSQSKNDAMVILKNGRVGIGTSSPSRTLEVSGNIQATTNSYAIRGVKTGSGTFPGVWGETESTSNNATGLRGYVLADNPGTGAAGVHGHVLSGSSSNGCGVKGSGAKGVGVYGETGSNGTGVFGEADGSSGRAVKGEFGEPIFINNPDPNAPVTNSLGELGRPIAGVYGLFVSLINSSLFDEVTTEHTGYLGSFLAGAFGSIETSLGLVSEDIGVLGSHSSSSGFAGYFDGNVNVTGDVVNPSDEKLKTNIQNLDNPLMRLTQLAPKTYDFKTDEYPFIQLPRGPQFGLISQEVEKVFPELVKEAFHRSIHDDPENPEQEILHYSALNYTGFIPIIIGAINELEDRTAHLDSDRLAALETMVQSQNDEIDAQEAQIEEIQSLWRELLEQNNRVDRDLQDCCSK